MKALCTGLLLITSTACSYATPSMQIIDSCLRTEVTAKNVQYTDINPSTFTEEEDVTRKITSTTTTFQGKEIGMWKSTESKNFGVIYGDKKIPARRMIKLSKREPSTVNPYTAQWGEARDAHNTYVCITFNFEGLGESGSFQDIRGLYLIEINRRSPKVYYTVGDIRR